MTDIVYEQTVLLTKNMITVSDDVSFYFVYYILRES